jgi:hypothetical protein
MIEVFLIYDIIQVYVGLYFRRQELESLSMMSGRKSQTNNLASVLRNLSEVGINFLTLNQRLQLMETG